MAETTVELKPNPGFDVEYMREPATRAELLRMAAEGVTIARGASPERTGRWRRSIQMVQDESGVGITADRGRWHWYEFGNYHMHPSAPLRRAIEGLGLTVRDSGGR